MALFISKAMAEAFGAQPFGAVMLSVAKSLPCTKRRICLWFVFNQEQPVSWRASLHCA